MRLSNKKMTVLAMLSALAYLTMLFFRIPVITVSPAFILKFDPKDTVLVIGGFLYGPLPALAMTTVVALIEMFTVSETGPVGLIMNIISSASFILPAVLLYKWKRNLAGAVAGLATGCVSVTACMLLWNYAVTPLYMSVPRSVVAGMLLSVFLPFNLIKSALNAALAMLLYKPAVTALRGARLYTDPAGKAARFNILAPLVSAAAIIALALIIMWLQGYF